MRLWQRCSRTGARPLYEQARYIAGCEARYGSRRAWMRAEGIDPRKWEPRFSKIAKINRLDPDLLSCVDPWTITNAEIVARIVDIWAEEHMRATALAILQKEFRKTNRRLNASLLFRRMIEAVDGPKDRLRLTEWEENTRNLVGATGKVVATVSRDGDCWTISGSDFAALSRSSLGSAFEALKI